MSICSPFCMIKTHSNRSKTRLKEKLYLEKEFLLKTTKPEKNGSSGDMLTLRDVPIEGGGSRSPNIFKFARKLVKS